MNQLRQSSRRTSEFLYPKNNDPVSLESVNDIVFCTEMNEALPPEKSPLKTVKLTLMCFRLIDEGLKML